MAQKIFQEHERVRIRVEFPDESPDVIFSFPAEQVRCEFTSHDDTGFGEATLQFDNVPDLTICSKLARVIGAKEGKVR